jgi:hypothetical protein
MCRIILIGVLRNCGKLSWRLLLNLDWEWVRNFPRRPKDLRNPKTKSETEPSPIPLNMNELITISNFNIYLHTNLLVFPQKMKLIRPRQGIILTLFRHMSLNIQQFSWHKKFPLKIIESLKLE